MLMLLLLLLLLTIVVVVVADVESLGSRVAWKERRGGADGSSSSSSSRVVPVPWVDGTGAILVSPPKHNDGDDGEKAAAADDLRGMGERSRFRSDDKDDDDCSCGVKNMDESSSEGLSL